jgi:hypothetical protein
MTTQTSETANEIVNTVAAEVGLTPAVDAYASIDASFIQMQYLLNGCIKELVRAFNWEFLVKEHLINVTAGGASEFLLPPDFMRMIDQTGWERKNRNPLENLSAQEWQYLKGRNLVSETIYAKFRIQQNKFTIFPSPPSSDLEIAFEYISNLAVIDSNNIAVKTVVTSGDRPLFDGHLLSRMLKVKWLQSKGFDSGAAEADLISAYEQATSGDKSAPILNAGSSNFGVPLLNSFNTSDTNYGIT